MNILQINTNDIRGGAAQVAYKLKNGLEKLGHQVSMFVGQKDSQDKNVSILNDKRSLGQKIRKKLSYYLADDIDLFSSDKILQTRQFKEADIVHCHNLHSYYFNLNTIKKISALKPIVWTFHDMWPITSHCAHAFDGKVENGFFRCPSLDIFPPIAWNNEKNLENKKREIYKNSDFTIVVPSDWLKQKVEKTILNDKPMSLIYNGIDTGVFKPYLKDKVRQELNLPFDKKIILTVAKGGLNNPWKGTEYASEVKRRFQNNKNIIFINVGTDVPFIKDEDTLAKYYSAADVLLYPSIADNCPLVVIEAQACGLPVIGFETGGVPEIVKNGETGYIAKYKDVQGLYDFVNRLINNKVEENKKMGEKSVDKMKEQFTLDLMVEKYVQLYDKVISQN